MKPPGPENAVVDARKLRDYCLSPVHPRGRRKARVFRASLGLRVEDAEELRGALLSAARSSEAVVAEVDEYGQRYVLKRFSERLCAPENRAVSFQLSVISKDKKLMADC